MERNLALEKINALFELHSSRTEMEYKKLLEENREQLTQKLLEAVMSLKKYYPIRVLQFQIMRTDLYQKKYRIQVCGYNKNWYMDEERTVSYVDITYLFEPFKELAKLLEEDLLKYMGAVSQYDIDNIVNEFFITCFNRSSTKMREGFFLFDEWLAQNNKKYRIPYRVMWGEYRGRTDILYLQDKLGKETADFEKECEKDQREGHLFFSYVDSNLADMKITNEKFAYLNLKKSNLKEVNFEKCVFGESMFRESVMEWCSYSESVFYGCNFSKINGYQLDFQNSSITNTGFENMKLRKGKFQGAKLFAVDFKNCVLEECDFRGATLSMVDLRAERLSGIDLTGAKLEEVYIHERDMEELHLSKEQSEHVYVLTED